jgi:23S rRNA (cytosine1962-C5)-methyltransferase
MPTASPVKSSVNIYLKPKRERPVLNGHPWIFSGAVERIEGDANSVGIADVFDNKKNWLARGHYNPATQLRVRLLTWKKDAIDEHFIAKRLGHAFALRTNYFPTTPTLIASLMARDFFRD